MGFCRKNRDRFNETFIFFARIYSNCSFRASGGGNCDEKITSLILTKDTVVFKSSKTCDGWCRVNPAWGEAQINRVYAMLLAAKTQDREVKLYWGQLDSDCGGKRPPESSPTYFYY